MDHLVRTALELYDASLLSLVRTTLELHASLLSLVRTALELHDPSLPSKPIKLQLRALYTLSTKYPFATLPRATTLNGVAMTFICLHFIRSVLDSGRWASRTAPQECSPFNEQTCRSAGVLGLPAYVHFP
jgi:hypothetical protein